MFLRPFPGGPITTIGPHMPLPIILHIKSGIKKHIYPLCVEQTNAMASTIINAVTSFDN